MLDALSAMRTAGAEVVFLSGGEAKQLLAELDATSGGTLDAGPTVGAVTFTGEARTLTRRRVQVAAQGARPCA